LERYASLNSSRGVVSTDALDGLPDEAIQSFPADQSRTYRRDDKQFPLRTVFSTFEVPDFPSHFYFDYERLPVRAYVPNPMRCIRFRNSGTYNSVVPLTSYAATAEKLGMQTPHAQIRPSVLIVKATTPPIPKNARFFSRRRTFKNKEKSMVCPSLKP
jgi:hypothetical protein